MTHQRPRILFVAHSASRGGAELCLDTLLRHLDRRRYDVTVLFPWEGPLAGSARALGLTVEIFPLQWWMGERPTLRGYARLLLRAAPNALRLAAYVRRHRFRLVYTNSCAVFEPALAARLAGVRHVWHVHEVFGSGLGRTLPLALHKKLIDRLSDRVLFESHSARRVFEGEPPSPKSRVVHNSLRLCDDGRDSPADCRRRLGLAPEDRVVGFVGQLIERKDPLLLLRAAVRVKEPGNFKLLFAGDGPLRAALAEQAAALGLAERCRFVGFHDDVRTVLRAIDLLVLPSREESFGLVLVEAAEFGKPVIATRTEGPCEIVAEGETGFLVEPGDAARLAERMGRLLRDPDERRRLGLAGRRRVRALFSAENNARLTEQILDEVLASAPSRRASGAVRREEAPVLVGE